jgi:membrane-bound serine protease (ClpP class)
VDAYAGTVLTLVALLLALLVLPSPWNWIVVVVAAAVDVVETIVFVWWSRRRRPSVGLETFVGRRAVAVEPLLPRGQVRIDGELWQARSPEPVQPGADVVVTGVDGLVLDVAPREHVPPT